MTVAHRGKIGGSKAGSNKFKTFLLLKLKKKTVILSVTKFDITKLQFLPTVYLCVLCGSENKQRLIPYTALADWFL